MTLFSEMVKERITEDLTNGLHSRKRQIGFGKLFKEIKAELALDDVEEGDLFKQVQKKILKVQDVRLLLFELG